MQITQNNSSSKTKINQELSPIRVSDHQTTTQGNNKDGEAGSKIGSIPSVNEFLEKKTNQSVLSSSKKAVFVPKNGGMSARNAQIDSALKIIDKEYKTGGWFKKNANFLVDTIDNLISDQSFCPTTIRIAILLLANIHILCKASGATKAFIKRK
jgi:hypothetical protein